jgi:hypothetical protein
MLKGRDVKGKGDVEGKGDGKPVVAVVRLIVVHCGAGRSSPSVVREYARGLLGPGRRFEPGILSIAVLGGLPVVRVSGGEVR